VITVDIYVPVLDASYDFGLDETTPIALLIDEIAAMVCSKEHWPLPASTSRMDLFSATNRRQVNGSLLFSPTNKRCLNRSKTLSEEAVVQGDRLILC